MQFGVDCVHITGNQHYRRRKWNSGIKSFVEEEMPCKTQISNDAQGQAPHQRIFIIAITTRPSPIGIPRDIYSGVAQNKVDVCCVDVFR